MDPREEADPQEGYLVKPSCGHAMRCHQSELRLVCDRCLRRRLWRGIAAGLVVAPLLWWVILEVAAKVTRY